MSAFSEITYAIKIFLLPVVIVILSDGNESGREAIQVSWALNETNQQREFDSLLKAGANAEASSCIVITSGDRSTFEQDGRTVEIIPA